ncbi:MAG: hypothetical protein K940chlam9_01065 [Chlamydiae bacterium]|nr:hypothetical protein [Chlamydiota bacterium]
MHIFSLIADASSLVDLADQEPNFNYMADFFHMLLTLGFIIVLIVITVFFLKKMMRSRMHALNKTTGIKILEKRSLNTKSSLYLVDILGKGVVISESPAGIHIVTELPEDMNVELSLQQLQEESPSPGSSFKETFRNKLRKLTNRNA